MYSREFRLTFEADCFGDYVKKFYVDGYVNRKRGKVTITDVYLTDKETGVEFAGKLEQQDAEKLANELENLKDMADDLDFWHDDSFDEYDEDMGDL
jgi:hypothetical protein